MCKTFYIVVFLIFRPFHISTSNSLQRVTFRAVCLCVGVQFTISIPLSPVCNLQCHSVKSTQLTIIAQVLHFTSNSYVFNIRGLRKIAHQFQQETYVPLTYENIKNHLMNFSNTQVFKYRNSQFYKKYCPLLPNNFLIS